MKRHFWAVAKIEFERLTLNPNCEFCTYSLNTSTPLIEQFYPNMDKTRHVNLNSEFARKLYFSLNSTTIIPLRGRNAQKFHWPAVCVITGVACLLVEFFYEPDLEYENRNLSTPKLSNVFGNLAIWKMFFSSYHKN